MKRIIASIALLAATTACATRTYEPVIDEAMSNPRPGATYPSDLTACRQLAEQRSAAAEATGGAVAGAVALGLLGALLGGDTGNLAAAGAGAGAASAGADAIANQQAIIRECLEGRGWAVLGR